MQSSGRLKKQYLQYKKEWNNCFIKEDDFFKRKIFYDSSTQKPKKSILKVKLNQNFKEELKNIKNNFLNNLRVESNGAKK